VRSTGSFTRTWHRIKLRHPKAGGSNCPPVLRIAAAAADDQDFYAGLVFIMRPAVAADVADLRALAVAADESYVPRIGRAPAPMEADYANAIRRAGVWVAVQHDLLVGLLVLVPQPDHLLVENVAVLPSTQGHGIGTGLLDLAESQARRHGLAERQASVS
jgi:GNAT superfamily N-acetyltransferase